MTNFKTTLMRGWVILWLIVSMVTAFSAIWTSGELSSRLALTAALSFLVSSISVIVFYTED